MSGHESKHYPFLTVEELPDFFKALAGYTGSPLVVLAARLLILTEYAPVSSEVLSGVSLILKKRCGKFLPNE